VVRSKYLHGELVSTVRHRLNDSPVWTGLLKIKSLYLNRRRIETKNGKNTLFWKDPWLCDKPICTTTPVVFDLCEEKDVTVHQFLVCGGQLKFTRWLPPILFEQWVETVKHAFNSQFCNTNDTVKWRWEGGRGVYTTRSMYDHLTREDEGSSFTHIWRAKIPYKIKIFTWLLENDAVLTKETWLKESGMATLLVCFTHK
jgi:hypothetical protein